MQYKNKGYSGANGFRRWLEKGFTNDQTLPRSHQGSVQVSGGGWTAADTGYDLRRQGAQEWGKPKGSTLPQSWLGRKSGAGARAAYIGGKISITRGPGLQGSSHTAPHLCLKALFTMALSTKRSPTWDGPRKWNISMAFSVGWARHSRLGTQE